MVSSVLSTLNGAANYASEAAIKKELAAFQEENLAYAKNQKRNALIGIIASTVLMALGIALIATGICLPAGIACIAVSACGLFYTGNNYTAYKNLENIVKNFSVYVSVTSYKAAKAAQVTTSVIHTGKQMASKVSETVNRYTPQFVKSALSFFTPNIVKNAASSVAKAISSAANAAEEQLNKIDVRCDVEKIKEDMKKGTFAFTWKTDKMAKELWHEEEENPEQNVKV